MKDKGRCHSPMTQMENSSQTGTVRSQRRQKFSCPCPHLDDEADVSGERLHPVEAGNQGDGQEAVRVHLAAQEEISLQVVHAEVIFSARTTHQ